MWLAHSSVNGRTFILSLFLNDDFDEVTRAVEAYKEAELNVSIPCFGRSKNIIHKEAHMYGARLALTPDLTLIPEMLGNLK